MRARWLQFRLFVLGLRIYAAETKVINLLSDRELALSHLERLEREEVALSRLLQGDL